MKVTLKIMIKCFLKVIVGSKAINSAKSSGVETENWFRCVLDPFALLLGFGRVTNDI